MSPTIFTKVTILSLLFLSVASAQVSSREPKNWKSGTPIGLESSPFLLDRVLQETVRHEILDTNTVLLIAQSVPLSEHEQTLFQVAPDSAGSDIWLYTLGREWTQGCEQFGERLNKYVLARADGHTRACLLEGLTNRTSLAAKSDPDLQLLASNYPFLPVTWFRKAETGATTNKAGVPSRSLAVKSINGNLQIQSNYTHTPKVDEVCRWSSYTLVDGDIGWQYVLRFTVDGTLDRIDKRRCDAKELDPQFQPVIREVDAEAEAEMKRDGTFGKFGSVHSFWALKKEKLKARGIQWRSPDDFNDAIHD